MLLWWRWQARRPRPRSITVSVTGRCNLGCRHCEKGRPDPAPADLPLASVLRLIDLAAELRVGLLLTGGEPCLHSEFREILRHARLRGVPVELNTNGFALADADTSLIELMNASIGLLRVSLDSADPGEHDAWRGRDGSHARALRLLCHPHLTCRREISAVLALDLHNAGPLLGVARAARCPIVFQPLVFGTNFPDLPCLDWKVAQQQLMPALAARATATVAELSREAARLGVRTNLAPLQSSLGAYYRAAGGPDCYADRIVPRFRCVIPYQRLTVDEAGRIAPCVFLPGEALCREGDVLRQWRSAAAAWRRRKGSRTRHVACRSCSCYFAENDRGSAVLSPIANRHRLAQLLRERSRHQA